MEKVKYIDIVFENCDSCRLLPDMFSGLWIEKVTKTYLINYFQYKNGEVKENLECSELLMFVNKKGMEAQCTMDKQNFSKRVNAYNDITHIDVVFENGTNQYISVPWDEKNDFENFRQKVTIISEEEIKISIN